MQVKAGQMTTQKSSDTVKAS